MSQFMVDLYEWLHPGTVEKIDIACADTDWNGYLNVTNIPLGLTYLLTGITYEALYLPCMIIMARPKFFGMTCYKILFAMGIVDMVSVVPNSIFAGYYLLVGGSMCNYMASNIWGGHIAYAMWCAYCLFGIILGLNRCLDFLAPSLGEDLFSGRRLAVIISLPFLFFIGVLVFDYGPFFHPYLAAYFFDVNPFQPKEKRPVHMINNFGVTVIVLVLNCIMLWSMIQMTRRTTQGVTKLQKVIVLQCLAICTIMVIASGIYATMQLVTLPIIFTVISTMMWQFSNGSNAIFYLLVNRSMRREVINLTKWALGMKIEEIKGSQGKSSMSKQPIIGNEKRSVPKAEDSCTELLTPPEKKDMDLIL